MIAVLAHPAYAWCVARVGRPSILALVMTMVIVSFVVVPGVALLLALLSSLESTFQQAAAYVTEVLHGAARGTRQTTGRLRAAIGPCPPRRFLGYLRRSSMALCYEASQPPRNVRV